MNQKRCSHKNPRRKTSKLDKQGQVTIFIILGIILVVGISFFFFMNSYSKKVTYESKPTTEANIIKNIVTFCLTNTSENAITELESLGGNINKTETLNDIQNYRTTPNTQKDIEKNMQEIILNKIPACINLRKRNLNFSASFSQPSVSTVLTNTSANIHLTMETTVSIGNSSVSIKEYEYVLNTEMLELSSFATSIANPPYYNGKEYCISCIKEFANKNNVIVNFFSQNKTNLALLTKLNNENNSTEEFLFRI